MNIPHCIRRLTNASTSRSIKMATMRSPVRHAIATLAALFGVMTATSAYASDNDADGRRGGYTFKILAALGDNVADCQRWERWCQV